MKQVFKRFLSLALSMLMVLSLLPTGVLSVTAYAATSGTVAGLLDANIGLTYSGSADDAWSASGTQITGSAQSTGGTCSDKSYNSTLTIKNNKATKATLSFAYAIEQNSGTIKVDGSTVTANGNFSKELEAGAAITVKIESGSTTATKITMTNVVLVSDVTATTTFVPAENGTYTVDGKAVTEEYSNTQSSMTAYQVVATPTDGYQFLGWYNLTTGKCIATAATTALNIESACTITAKFVSKSLALFETGGQRFADLNEAVAYAQANGQPVITLATDGSISGSYTIPADITLLIPFDEAGTLYTDSPAAIRTTPASKAFRTLTMSEGTSITVNGAISLGGRYFAAGGGQQGRPVGDYGYIKMADSSSITVKNGGNLYAWGFISGNGSILAESGATVYEFYQIADFRGGSASSGMGNKVFPFSQYFVQNIEVPLTLNAGANEIVFSGVFAMSTTYATSIKFIGDNGMFKVVSGSFTKDYDEKTDRLILTVNGEAQLNTLALKLAGMSVNSASYVLPITNNISINIQSGKVAINQDTALLAGVEVNIAEGADLTVSSGKNLYVYAADEWNSDNFVWGSCKFKSVAYAPGKAYNRSNADLKDVKIDVNGTLTAIGAIYTTAGGADICSSNRTGDYIQRGALGTETVTHQYNASSNDISIAITPAKLHNANTAKPYTETAGASAGDVFKYVKDQWIKNPCTITFDANCDGINNPMEPITVSAGESFVLPECEIIRGGYDFAGWNTEKGGTGTSYADQAEITVTKDTTLYAQWKCLHEGETESRGAKEATCTKDGYTGDTYCSTCGDKLSEGTVIPATGHTEVIDAAVEATCTTPGKTEGKHCSVCSEILVAQTEVPAKGHSWNDGEITTAATCENAGVKTYTCTACSETKTEALDPTGHTPVDVDAQPATCTEAGHKAGTKCDVCGAILSGMEETPATGHTEVIDAAVEPTCTETGKTEGKHCSVCNEITVAQKVVPATGHTPVEVAAVEATCTEAGHTAGTKCEVCGETLSGLNKVPATGHTEVIDAAVEPTCTEPGKTEGKHCEVCGKTLVEQTEIPAAGHKEELRNAKEATLAEDGYTGDTYCSVCDTLLKEGTVIPRTGVAITWIVDGVVTAKYYEKGTVPSYDGEPTKAEDKHYTYTFTGWDKDLVAATEETTYTAQFTATGKNGLCTEDDGIYWLENGEHVTFPGLIRIDAGTEGQPHYHYYYFGEDGKAVKDGDYKVDKNNGLPLPCYQYAFDADGVIIHDEDTSKNGICEGDGSKFNYIDGIKVGEGLIRGEDGKYYYARTSTGEIVRNQRYWITKLNNYYNVKSGMYYFDEDGVMQIDGFVEVNGDTYYYANCTLVTGFTKIGEDYYIFNAVSGKMYKDATMWVGANDAYGIKGGMYYFDADGKMVIPDTVNGEKKIVNEDGKLYFTIDGARMYSGLYELDGAYYYARSNGQLVVNGVAYIDATPLKDEDGEGWYGFDAEGKLIMTGFVIGGDGYTYYYNNGTRTKGFTQIDNDYYFFNAGSGKMYKDVTLWVGANDSGVKVGMHDFGTDGKMANS